jgi:hypothetical protein
MGSSDGQTEPVLGLLGVMSYNAGDQFFPRVSKEILSVTELKNYLSGRNIFL